LVFAQKGQARCLAFFMNIKIEALKGSLSDLWAPNALVTMTGTLLEEKKSASKGA